MLKAMVVVVALLGGCDACKQVTGSCCKTCKTSKACGDSCISSSQSCSKFGGCACNGLVEEVQQEISE